jgi:hypothetical protein
VLPAAATLLAVVLQEGDFVVLVQEYAAGGNLCLASALAYFLSMLLLLLLFVVQEGDFVVLVQEYAAGGNLFELLQKYGGRLNEHVTVQMVLEPFLRVLQVRWNARVMNLALLRQLCVAAMSVISSADGAGALPVRAAGA